jgi:hypothetical protein
MMKAQENIKNDEINVQADALTDLPVADEQADRATGGGAASGRIYVATEVGVFVT